jgi:flagellar biosynthesis chaperone FliJ
VERLVELGREAVNAARASVGAAARAVAEARDDASREEHAWSDAAQVFGTGVARASDLAEQSAHLRTLRHRADAASRRLERAVLEERRCAAAVVKAAMELRKLELWRDRMAQGEREEEQRQEQRRSDELAARIGRTRA